MNTRILLIIACLLGGLSLELSAQDTQTLRGRVVSSINGAPAPDYEVRVVFDGKMLSDFSDALGSFSIEGLPTVQQLTVECYYGGELEASERVILQKSYSEEIVLEVTFVPLSEGNIEDGWTPIPPGPGTNAVSTKIENSASTIKVDINGSEQSIAAADDVSRIVMRQPGVKSWSDNLADVVIRANSPMGLMWRLEGIDIPNPNHFARKGNTGGGITMFSAQVLGDVTFHTGAWAPQYGNSLAGAFDVNFRNGNSKERQYRARVGAIGLDFAAEGPLSKDSTRGGSYLVNYRYSFLGILNSLGFNINANRTSNNFQDLSFNVYLPSKDLNTKIKVFGVGGLSREFWAVDPDAVRINGNGREERIFNTETGIVGVSYDKLLTFSSRFKATIAIMANRVTDRDEQIDITNLPVVYDSTDLEGLPRDVVENEVYTNGRIAANLTYLKYWGAKTLQAGVQVSQMNFNFLHDDVLPFQNDLTRLVSGRDNSQLIQPYVQIVAPFYGGSGKDRRETWKIAGGVHMMYLTLNNEVTLDPRLAITYNYSKTGLIELRYGLHSMMVPLGSYFTENRFGEKVNLDLKMIRSHHYNVIFRQIFPKVGAVIIEGYLQDLFNVPVSRDPSAYWLLNDRDGYATQDLVSTGTGRNMGVDARFTRPLAQNVFWTLAGSIYRSTASTSDGETRPSSFVGPEGWGYYAANTIGGEIALGAKRKAFLQLGATAIAGTGTRYIPFDESASLAAGQLVLDSEGIYSERTGNYFRIDTRVAVRTGDWLFSLDFQNATNREHIRGVWMRFGVPDVRPQSEFTPLFSIRRNFGGRN